MVDEAARWFVQQHLFEVSPDSSMELPDRQKAMLGCSLLSTTAGVRVGSPDTLPIRLSGVHSNVVDAAVCKL
jgi:hypothetical protein